MRDPFPGNIIPKSLFDPGREFLAQNPFTAPNQAGTPAPPGPPRTWC